MGRFATFDMNGGVKLPNTLGDKGTLIQSDGTNLVNSAYKIPGIIPTSGKLLQSNGTDITATAYKLPSTAPTTGTILQSNGTDVVASSYAIPATVPTVGKLLQSNGTNVVSSAYALPTTLPTVGQILQSDGTSVAATAYTLPTAAGTAGNVLQSDGTNFVSASTGSIAATVAASLPTVSYWNQGVVYAPTLPGSETMLAGKTGVTTLTVTGSSCPVNTSATNSHLSSSGVCCLWTVPTGATEAEFQIWGGGGNSAACSHGTCCALGFSGGNGEYTYVRMKVTAGQTYTLCAGGAACYGSCYSSCNADGCNSFVCGSNSTCIVSCGGTSSTCGYYPFIKTYYPDADLAAMACDGNSTTMWMGTCAYASGGVHQSYRFGAQCGVGGVATANTTSIVAKVPSSHASQGTCGSNYLYACYNNKGVNFDHTTANVIVPYNSQCYGFGCMYSSCGENASYSVGNVKRFPGMGGVFPSYVCGSYDNTYGDRGSAGLIRVSYK